MRFLKRPQSHYIWQGGIGHIHVYLLAMSRALRPPVGGSNWACQRNMLDIFHWDGTEAGGRECGNLGVRLQAGVCLSIRAQMSSGAAPVHGKNGQLSNNLLLRLSLSHEHRASKAFLHVNI